MSTPTDIEILDALIVAYNTSFTTEVTPLIGLSFYTTASARPSLADHGMGDGRVRGRVSIPESAQ